MVSSKISCVVDYVVTLIAAANGATRLTLLETHPFPVSTPGGFSSAPHGKGFQPVGPSLSGRGVRITRPSQRVVYSSGRIIEKGAVVSTGNLCCQLSAS